MRLKEKEVKVIKSTILKYIPDAKIILFGSRVFDNKRGGDIDIFVETKHIIDLKKEIKILADLEFNGIERKVDLIIKTPNSKDKPIFRTIYKEGIVL